MQELIDDISMNVTRLSENIDKLEQDSVFSYEQMCSLEDVLAYLRNNATKIENIIYEQKDNKNV